MRAELPAFVGETCAVRLQSGEQLTAEVVGFDDAESQLMCFDSTAGLQPGLEITVQLDNGRMLAVTQAADEPFYPGDRVRVLTGYDGTTRVAHY